MSKKNQLQCKNIKNKNISNYMLKTGHESTI